MEDKARETTEAPRHVLEERKGVVTDTAVLAAQAGIVGAAGAAGAKVGGKVVDHFTQPKEQPPQVELPSGYRED